MLETTDDMTCRDALLEKTVTLDNRDRKGAYDIDSDRVFTRKKDITK